MTYVLDLFYFMYVYFFYANYFYGLRLYPEVSVLVMEEETFYYKEHKAAYIVHYCYLSVTTVYHIGAVLVYWHGSMLVCHAHIC